MIELNDVEFGYDETSVLKKVSFSIGDGEYVGIIGPNGGGKTTLLKLILGFLKPKSGRITIDTESIGYVPQQRLYDRQFPLSVLEFVGLGLVTKKNWKKKARENLKRVSLLEYEGRPFSTLSGGQLQRALIARALISDPKLLLLDEPTANLDVDAQEDVHTLLKSLKGEITIVMVSHDLQTIATEVDRILCVQGKVTPLMPKELCEHFTMGLYHKPLLDEDS